MFNVCLTWITLYENGDNVSYFDSFGVKHILKEIKRFIGNKNIMKIIYRIQAHISLMCGYFCIGFVDFMLKCKSLLLHYTNLFSPDQFQKSDKILLEYFQWVKSSFMNRFWI